MIYDAPCDDPIWQDEEYKERAWCETSLDIESDKDYSDKDAKLQLSLALKEDKDGKLQECANRMNNVLKEVGEITTYLLTEKLLLVLRGFAYSLHISSETWTVFDEWENRKKTVSAEKSLKAIKELELRLKCAETAISGIPIIEKIMCDAKEDVKTRLEAFNSIMNIGLSLPLNQALD